MLINRNLHKKSSEVSIKTRSTSDSLSFKGQATKHTTVKWSIHYAIARTEPFNKLEDEELKTICKIPHKAVEQVPQQIQLCRLQSSDVEFGRMIFYKSISHFAVLQLNTLQVVTKLCEKENDFMTFA